MNWALLGPEVAYAIANSAGQVSENEFGGGPVGLTQVLTEARRCDHSEHNVGTSHAGRVEEPPDKGTISCRVVRSVQWSVGGCNEP